MRGILRLSGLLALGATLGLPPALAQPTVIHEHGVPTVAIDGPIIIVPPVRPRPWPGRPTPVRLEAVNASVAIDAQVATTTTEYSLRNPAGNQQEAQFLIPVPEGVSIRSLQYDGVGPEPTAKLLPREEARRIYDSIVNRSRDPALLEFVGYNLIKTSVFPVPPGALQKVRITYEQLLPADGDRIDYVLPRSDSLEASGVNWTMSATIKSKRPIATVYSPSHDLALERVGGNEVRVKVTGTSANEPGSFRISYLLQKDSGLSASILAYPDPEFEGGRGGYLMLLAGMPELKADQKVMKREVVVVLDRSGSMRGPKMEQAKAAALQVVEGLEEGEAFNIIDYSDSINSFAEKPVIKTVQTIAEARKYIKAITAGGGTNINDSLQEALRPRPTEGMLPMVLFMTDGLPTVGERSEVAIREAAKSGNRFNRRIFSFGVGFDVNAPLLTAVARATRGTSTFVLPEEDVEVKVSQVYRRLSGPVLADPKLTVLGSDGSVSTRLVRDPQPNAIPDLFEGDQLVLLARYTGEEKLRLKLEGNYLGAPKSFEFAFDPDNASARNGFVPRLWATRKIAALIEEVRSMGAAGAAVATSDPRFKELVDEIVRLSTKFGVLTEYTAFLATEPGAVAWREDAREGRGEWERLRSVQATPPSAGASVAAAHDELAKKAVEIRGGGAGVAQESNNDLLWSVSKAPARQNYKDKDMKQVNLEGCQTINDKALFFRNQRWVDSSMLANETDPPEQTVEFGTPEFTVVLDQLVKENRQGVLSRGGEVYLRVQGKRVLCKLPS